MMEHRASDGFFDVDDAEKVAAARQKWLEDERKMSAGMKASKRLGDVAAARIKALYPRIEGDGEIHGRTVPKAVSHLPQAAEQEVHRGSVVAQGNDGCHNPRLDQEGKFCVGRVGSFVRFCIGHALILLRLRKAGLAVDSKQAKAAKEAA